MHIDGSTWAPMLFERHPRTRDLLLELGAKLDERSAQATLYELCESNGLHLGQLARQLRQVVLEPPEEEADDEVHPLYHEPDFLYRHAS